MELINKKQDQDPGQSLLSRITSQAESRDIIRMGQKSVSFDQVMKYFMAVAGVVRPGFVIDDDNRDLVYRLCKYFSRYLESDLDKNKGVLIWGTVGTGKTLLMEIFVRIGYHSGRPMRIINAYRMALGLRMGGEDTGRVYDEIRSSRSRYELIVDDLGMDDPMKVFGSPVDFTDEIIYSRYDSFRRGVLTHATTNLTEDQLRERLNYRSFDRLREMFNLVPIIGESRRK